MNRFSLLRLPFLALQEVIQSTDKTDVINLAMTSKKMCRIVNITKNGVSIQKLLEKAIIELSSKDKLNVALLENPENSREVMKSMKLEVSTHLTLGFSFFQYIMENNGYAKREIEFQIQINSVDDKIEGKQEIIKFGDIDVPVVISKNIIFSFWEDIQYGSQFLGSHFLQKFKFHTVSLHVKPEENEGCKFSRSLVNAVDILKTALVEKADVWVSNIYTTSDLQVLFGNMKYGDIEILGSLNRKILANFQCEAIQLNVHETAEFSLKNLLNSKCSKVLLGGTQMTNRVMKKVLIHWLNQKLEALETLEIELYEELNIETILTEFPETDGHVLKRSKNAISIKRRDGKRAVIRIPEEEAEEEENKTFKMDIY